MPSPRSAALASLLLCVPLLAGSGLAAVPATATPGAAPTHAEIDAALERLRHDPKLGRERTVKTLHWVNANSHPPPAPQSSNWLLNLFEFLSQGASLLLWAAGALAAGVVAVWVLRVLKARRIAPAAAAAPPSQLQALDIRPASLPDDVGTAALALLEAGKTRECLSLLYRGALSRAVHRFRVPIDASHTEGEALRAVQRGLDAPRAQYFAALIAQWLRAVYAADVPEHEPLARLCREFSPLLDERPI